MEVAFRSFIVELVGFRRLVDRGEIEHSLRAGFCPSVRRTTIENLLTGTAATLITTMTQKGKLHYSFRLYVTSRGKRILGKGGAQILDAVDRLGSISAAANELNMSYRFVWNYLNRIEQRLGKPVLITRRGGTGKARRRGGGGAQLTAAAIMLLKSYRATEARIEKQLDPEKINSRLRCR